MSFTPDQLRGKGFVEQADGSFTKEAQIGNLQRPPQANETGEATYGLPLSVQPRQPVAHENERQSTEERLNKTEKRFLAKLRSEDWNYVGIQEITLRLGFDTRYCPDFHTVSHDGQVTFFEVKGFMRDDARVKLYSAASKFNYWRFILVRWEKGAWNEQIVKS